MADELKPCPFCGGDAAFERLGSPRQSCIVSCNNCGCRLEANENWDFGTAWNARTDTSLAMVAAAYEAAWRVIWPRPLNGPPRKPTADDGPEYRQAYQVQLLAWRDAQEIRARTSADAQAALDRVKREARNEALDDVLKEVEGYLPEFGAGEPQDGTDLIIDQCWRSFRKVVSNLALMGDTDDE
ncbi:Lar family restriction alleviation protein [Roseovarius sp.]